MTGQLKTSGIEELEAADGAVKQPDDLAPAKEFKDESPLCESPEGEAEDEFKNLDEGEILAEDQPPGNGRRPPSNVTLAGLAARTALQWGSQATATSVLKGYGHSNGYRLVFPMLEDVPVGLLQADFLDGGTLRLFRDIAAVSDSKNCSAAILEEYELMAALAIAAARSESHIEAEGLIAALAPISIRLYPQSYRTLWSVLPTLIQGAVGVTRLLRSRPVTRPLIGALPVILRSATAHLARYVEHGQPITRALAARVLAKQTRVALHRWRQTQAGARHPYGAK